MKYLLDTHIVLWLLEGNRKKLNNHLDIVKNAENELFISVVSQWEITEKNY